LHGLTVHDDVGIGLDDRQRHGRRLGLQLLRSKGRGCQLLPPCGSGVRSGCGCGCGVSGNLGGRGGKCGCGGLSHREEIGIAQDSSGKT
jgi:hypothetical protein